MKIVSQCREQAERAYNGAVFEAEKKIPVFLVTQGQEADLERR
jgi:hypothetical protein